MIWPNSDSSDWSPKVKSVPEALTSGPGRWFKLSQSKVLPLGFKRENKRIQSQLESISWTGDMLTHTMSHMAPYGLSSRESWSTRSAGKEGSICLRRYKKKREEGLRWGETGRGTRNFPISEGSNFLLHYLHCLPLSSKKLTYDLRINPPLWLHLPQIYFHYCNKNVLT